MQLPNGDWLSYQFVFYDETGDEEIYSTIAECIEGAIKFLHQKALDMGLTALIERFGDVDGMFYIEESWFLSKDDPEYSQVAMDACEESHTTNECIIDLKILEVLEDTGRLMIMPFESEFDVPLDEYAQDIADKYQREHDANMRRLYGDKYEQD